MRSTLVLVLLLLAALPARAQRPGGDTGWAELLRPDHRRARRRIREGLRRLLRSRNLNHELGDAPRYLVLDGALRRFERARRVMGDDAELAYFVATALTEWERPDAYGGTEYRSVEAIHAWREVRRIDPDFMPQRVAYQLAMLHMRQHEFRRALAEYEVALATTTPPPVQLAFRAYMPSRSERILEELFAPVEAANLQGNRAEALMLVGDVRRAIEGYRRAHDLTRSPISRVLAQWGLALASERSGDHDSALEWAERAMRENPIAPDDPDYGQVRRRHGGFAPLHLDGVFFEPPCEIHAYEALGHEAVARRERNPDPDRALDAVRSLRLFLAEGGVRSPYAEVARARVSALEALEEHADRD